MAETHRRNQQQRDNDNIRLVEEFKSTTIPPELAEKTYEEQQQQQLDEQVNLQLRNSFYLQQCTFLKVNMIKSIRSNQVVIIVPLLAHPLTHSHSSSGTLYTLTLTRWICRC